MEFNDINIGLCAHRGNVGSIISEENCRDNSKKAVEYALKRPYITSIELDIRKCKDGLVVVHDENTNKMHGTIHRAIRDLTVKELSETEWHDYSGEYVRKMMASIFFPNPIGFIRCTKSKLESRETVISLEEMLDFVLETNSNMELLLELKGNDLETAKEFTRCINRYFRYFKNMKLQGFDENVMREVKDNTDVPTGLLVGLNSKRVFEDSYIENYEFKFMSIPWLSLSKDLVRKFYDYEKGFNVYTANNIVPYKILSNILKVLKEEENIDFSRIGIQPQLITNVPDIIYDYMVKCKRKGK